MVGGTFFLLFMTAGICSCSIQMCTIRYLDTATDGQVDISKKNKILTMEYNASICNKELEENMKDDERIFVRTCPSLSVVTTVTPKLEQVRDPYYSMVVDIMVLKPADEIFVRIFCYHSADPKDERCSNDTGLITNDRASTIMANFTSARQPCLTWKIKEPNSLNFPYSIMLSCSKARPFAKYLIAVTTKPAYCTTVTMVVAPPVENVYPEVQPYMLPFTHDKRFMPLFSADRDPRTMVFKYSPKPAKGNGTVTIIAKNLRNHSEEYVKDDVREDGLSWWLPKKDEYMFCAIVVHPDNCTQVCEETEAHGNECAFLQLAFEIPELEKDIHLYSIILESKIFLIVAGIFLLVLVYFGVKYWIRFHKPQPEPLSVSYHPNSDSPLIS